MAAGLGFKDFTTGEVLTAADVDGYLMQGIWVFADSTARDAAVTSPQEGNFAFLKDTNTTTYYTGSAWTNLDTTGMVNPMTTTGDVIYSSSGSTPARLGLGTAGQVLQVNSGATAPEWATAASGGGMTLINTGGTTLTGASVTISSIPSGYNYLSLFVSDFKPATDATALNMRFNSDSGNNYIQESGSGNNSAINDTKLLLSGDADNTSANGFIVADIFNYLSTTAWRITRINSWVNNATTPANGNWTARTGVYGAVGSAITSVTLLPASGNFTSGTAYLYGVK